MNWIKSPKDFWAGVMYIGFGLATVLMALGYHVGTAARMGPGYFPRGLGSLMILLGVVLGLRGVRLQGPKIWLGSFKPLLVVLGSVLLFGVTIPFLGLALSTFLLVVASSMASNEFRWKETVIAAVLLAAFAVGAFAWALGVQMPVWPSFFQQ